MYMMLLIDETRHDDYDGDVDVLLLFIRLNITQILKIPNYHFFR